MSDSSAQPKWDFKSMKRHSNDRVLGGVCGGLGAYSPVPSWVWRVIFILSAIFLYGAGLIVYVVLWISMPSHTGTTNIFNHWRLREMKKSSTDYVLCGVCGGLGEYSPMPSWFWRAAFLLGTFLFFMGAIVYLVLWATMPAATQTGN